jgi:dTDP-4-dehydrorhamnose reductase
VEHDDPDPLPERRRRVLITGAGGQLGSALTAAFSRDHVIPLGRDRWDVTRALPPGLEQPDLVLHAAAWTDVDGAEQQPDTAAATNVAGVEHAAALGAPLVSYSTDYVFDGTKGAPYVESDQTRPCSVYGETKLRGERAAGDRAWVIRTAWLFAPSGHNFVRTMLRLGAEQDEVAVVDDQRGSPTYAPHLATATRALVDGGAPYGIWHLTAEGECTWAEIAEAVFAEAGISCRVRRITTSDLRRPARRPAYSVLRSERPGAPVLPHWRDGLRACLDALRDGPRA